MKHNRSSIKVISALRRFTTRYDHGSEAHLREAIQFYKHRKSIYSDLTQGASNPLFRRLILMERMLLPVARIFDGWAVPFRERDIPVIFGDFVSMDSIIPPEKPINAAQPWNKTTESKVKSLVNSFSRIRGKPHHQIAEHCHKSLMDIDNIEQQHQVYLALLRHMVESIGFSSLHAISYDDQSSGATSRLTYCFVYLQILSVNNQVSKLDEIANQSHQKGVGVLVNDLPSIPFQQEYYNSTHS